MGMYDTLALFGDTFKQGDRFVVTGAEYGGKITTVHGPAEMAILTIVSREHPDTKRKYQALGVGLARQAKQAESGDFPHVAELIEVPTGNEGNRVKLLARIDVAPRAFIDGDDGPELVVEDIIKAGDSEGIETGTALGF